MELIQKLVRFLIENEGLTLEKINTMISTLWIILGLMFLAFCFFFAQLVYYRYQIFKLEREEQKALNEFIKARIISSNGFNNLFNDN